MTAEKKPDDPAADEPKERSSGKIEISTPQVAGGALASVTAAFLGSQLGVVGTVWGAGLTSVVITVGGALYQRSLEKTRNKTNLAAAKAALKRSTKQPLTGLLPPSMREEARRAGFRQDRTRHEDSLREGPQRGGPAGGPAAPREQVDPARTRFIRSPQSSGMQWPGGEHVIDLPRGGEDAGETRALRQGTAHSDAGDARTKMINIDHPPTSSPLRRIRWAMLAVTSAMIFGAGMLVVTGFESITGKPLSGGQPGTTMGHVFQRAPAPSGRQERPSEPEPERHSGTTSVEPSSQPTTEAPTQEPGPTSTTPTAPTAPSSPGTTAEEPSRLPTNAPGQPAETGVIGQDSLGSERR